jgi:hypothetical protein
MSCWDTRSSREEGLYFSTQGRKVSRGPAEEEEEEAAAAVSSSNFDGAAEGAAAAAAAALSSSIGSKTTPTVWISQNQ